MRSDETPTLARAHARVGLLGNPSDIYGGKGLGFAVAELHATAELRVAPTVVLPDPLLQAGWHVAAALLRELGRDPDARPFTLRVETTIPLQSGLAGSSALLTAAFRAWCAWFDVELTRERLAQEVLAVETEVLGQRAGPLDRLVQAFEGLVFMDFSRPFEPGATEPMDPLCLPRLLVVWDPAPGQPSGDVHAEIGRRFDAGDLVVRGAMEELAALAVRGRQALEVRDRAALATCMDRNFDLRAALFPIDARDLQAIDLGRQSGAATKFCGSGGSVLVLPGADDELDPLRDAYHEAGFVTLVPTVKHPRG